MIPKQCKNKTEEEAGGEKPKGNYYCDYLINCMSTRSDTQDTPITIFSISYMSSQAVS